MIHIGDRIKQRLKQINRTPSWLAQEICCDRTNVYKIFMRSSIDTALLMKISRALNYNFFKELADIQEHSSEKSATNVWIFITQTTTTDILQTITFVGVKKSYKPLNNLMLWKRDYLHWY